MTAVTLMLDQEESNALGDLSRRTGRTPEEILGEVVHRFLTPSTRTDWQSALRQATGIWKDRNDLPPLTELRREWDRRVSEGL
jgi:hypothetical protein